MMDRPRSAVGFIYKKSPRAAKGKKYIQEMILFLPLREKGSNEFQSRNQEENEKEDLVISVFTLSPYQRRDCEGTPGHLTLVSEPWPGSPRGFSVTTGRARLSKTENQTSISRLRLDLTPT